MFQAAHPLLTMLNVRGAGQLSHNELDVRLLRRLRPVRVQRVVFRFGAASEDDESPPLSWHLTPNQEERLEQGWRTPEIDRCRQAVRRFLAGEPIDDSRRRR